MCVLLTFDLCGCRRYDMLPSVLSAQLCSLLGSVERYAVSVTWELHPATYKAVLWISGSTHVNKG